MIVTVYIDYNNIDTLRQNFSNGTRVIDYHSTLSSPRHIENQTKA